jgi:hypothetical protein
MPLNADHLYQLLPAIYRIRDHEQGEPLRALLSLIAEQVGMLEEDLEQLYDDQFIETCAEWVVPYIGDLLGVRGLRSVEGITRTSRAEVAHTIGYRRRKGTAAILGQLAHDVTAWPASVVEFFERLAATQYLNHIRPDKGGTISLRNQLKLERLNGPFDPFAHTVDVRLINSKPGYYNIPNIGIFLWRLTTFPLTNVPAFPVGVDSRRFLFNPLGINTALFNKPRVAGSSSNVANPLSIPEPIGRRALYASLPDYYPVCFSIRVGDRPIVLDELVVCNLSDLPDGNWMHTAPASKVAVDPVLGRIALGEGLAGNVRVSFHYGFSAPIGGGEYDRQLQRIDDPIRIVQDSRTSIQDTISSLEGRGAVEIAASDTFNETISISVDAGRMLMLRAANLHRPLLRLSGEMVIEGGVDSTAVLDGLVVTGNILRVRGNLSRLILRHCTLVPGQILGIDATPLASGQASLIIESNTTEVIIDHSIIGPIRANSAAQVIISNSVVDAAADIFSAYEGWESSAGGTLTIDNSTIIGKVETVKLEASNSIFQVEGITQADYPVHAQRIQDGCVRYCYVPRNARVARRYRCQPDQEDESQHIRPQFNSLRYGNPRYCQLALNCPVEIRRGADDEAEMGVFHNLMQPLREDNLRVRLDEYLRFGLEAGIFYVS